MVKKRFNELSPEERLKRLQANPNSVLMKGEEKNLFQITDWYYEQIQAGFDWTLDDIVAYLDCSYDYALRNIAPLILHIRITDSVRPHLLKRKDAHNYYQLLYKRMLFNRESWKRHLLENGSYELKYERVSLSKTKELRDWTNHHGLTVPKSRNLLDCAFEGLVKERGIRVEPNTIVQIPLQDSQLEATWLSMKSMMKTYDFDYPVQVYRFLENRGVNPIRIGNFVRYNQDEIETEDVLSYPFSLFQEVKRQLGKQFIYQWIKMADKNFYHTKEGT